MPDDPKVRMAATTVPLGEQPVAETLSPDAATVGDPGLVANARALPAKTIGRFEIKSQLGEGGMGVVLLATDPLLGRKNALKVLHRGADDDRAKRRLMREAQGIAQVTHDNVIVVHEVGTHEDQVFVAMEYVSGGTLTRWQNDKRTWREVLAMYQLAGRGLVAAHEAGLVHRDFKGDNVLVGDDGRVRVTDFGLVAAMGTGESSDLTKTEQALRKESELAVSLTQTGAVMGTPRYMAPEQHLGQPLDARADQFAFCVALYEALYKQPPFAGESYQVLMCNVLAAEVVPPPESSDVPIAIRDAVLRGLARQRDDRHPSMRALLEALTLDATPPMASVPKRRWWLVAALAVPLVGLAGGVAYWSYETDDRAAAAESHAHALEEKLASSSAFDVGDGPSKPVWALGVSKDDQQRALELFSAGNKLLTDGHFEQAAKTLGDAVHAWNHPAIHYNLALALLNLGRTAEAREHFEAALAFPGGLDADKVTLARKYRKAIGLPPPLPSLDATSVTETTLLAAGSGSPATLEMVPQDVAQPIELRLQSTGDELIKLDGDALATGSKQAIATRFVVSSRGGSNRVVLESLANMTITSSASSTRFHSDHADPATGEALQWIALAYPDWQAIPTAAIGVGATWRATTAIAVGSGKPLTRVADYTLVGRDGTLWTIRWTSKITGDVEGSGSGEITMTEGALYPVVATSHHAIEVTRAVAGAPTRVALTLDAKLAPKIAH